MGTINQRITNIIKSSGRWGHLLVFTLCVIGGLFIIPHHTYPGKVPLSGDEWEYQSIAVNFAHGHGFPLAGGYEDSSGYKFYTYDGLPNSHSWQFFYTQGKYLDCFRNPAYPLFVGTVYKIFSVRPDIAKLVQLILLILAGSLLPYICYRMSGPKGILIGIFSYIAFLFFDSHYASSIMTEALIVVYIIVLIFLYAILDHADNPIHAFIIGFALGFGLLLKNYFMPSTIIIVLYYLYLTFIAGTRSVKVTLILISGLALSILPWTAYINHKIKETNTSQSFILVTSQGDNLLIDCNNESAIDGGWHPEWVENPESFYNQPSVKHYPTWRKVFIFYRHRLYQTPKYFSAKIMKGWFVTMPQLYFYISVLAFMITYQTKRRWLLLLPFLGLVAVIFLREKAFEYSLNAYIHSFFNIRIVRYELVILILILLWKYFRLQIKERQFNAYLPLLMLVNFFLLTLVFYGLARINGVVDVICLILTYYNIFEIISLMKDRNRVAPQNSY